ncbi:type I restriction endonuclease subunit S [Nocardioides aromaticivorans]|uniref:Type I restriction endonuclease subunit S n=1 Tax=Nocardioides aromaticivorans TaxID=200618 RepID=A0ABX7PM92_9ACTN|nr:restriction endonuclease subunit S [Nocardioides aromaticivorans]QSR26865.1 type I restriction endonuclease subunit S [Nocardioides aromaticivorans]
MKTVELGSVASIERKGVDPSSVAPETLYLGLEHIERGGRIIGHDTVGGAELASTKFQFNPEHVLFGKLRPNLGKISRPDFAGVCSTDILPIRPGKDLDRDYLAHFLAQPSMVDFASSRTSGANLPRLSPTVLAKFPIPLPPLPEQRRIAAILDHADALRTKRRDVLALLDGLGPAVFRDMFGNPVTNERRWPVKRLAELGTLDRGVSKHRPRNDPALLGGAYPLIQTGDVANSGGYIRQFHSTYSDLGLAQSRMWPAGTLCITIAANIAKTGILTFNACFPDSVVGFTSDPETITFVQAWLGFLQATLEASAPQSAQKNINLAILRELKVPIPGGDLLKEFDERISALKEHRAHTGRDQAELDAVFDSLQSRAFRGEL